MSLLGVLLLAVQPAAGAARLTAPRAAVAAPSATGAGASLTASMLSLPAANASLFALPTTPLAVFSAPSALTASPSALTAPQASASSQQAVPLKTAQGEARHQARALPVAAAPSAVLLSESKMRGEKESDKTRAKVGERVGQMSGALAGARSGPALSAHLGGLFDAVSQKADGPAAYRFDFDPGIRSPITLPAYAVNYKEEPAKLEPMPGAPYVRVGKSLIDTRAPGAAEVIDSFKAMRSGALVLGMFNDEYSAVLNAFAWGRDGVIEHKHALNDSMDRRHTGGYTFMMQADGGVFWRESGGVYLPLTPIIKRAVLRYLGVRPAEMSPWQAFARWVVRQSDRLRVALAMGVLRPY